VQTAKLVAEHWSSIVEVAEELLLFERLDIAELECILGGDRETLAEYREKWGAEMLVPPRNSRGLLGVARRAK
jgi:hypothetical protein